MLQSKETVEDRDRDNRMDSRSQLKKREEGPGPGCGQMQTCQSTGDRQEWTERETERRQCCRARGRGS